MKYDVFISYRREGGTHQADALESKLLLKRKGCRVFLDRSEIRGEDWKKKIDESIRESCNFVVIISKGCFPHKGEGTDYFLLEIDQALRMGKNVIPVYYDGMEYDDIKDYLAGIEGFHNRNHITFNNNNTDGSVDQIIKFLKTEKEVLNKRYKSLCTEKTAVREELLLLEGEKLELECPVCANSYTVDLTYCHVCGYKFFDELEKSAAEKSEKLQELGRLKKHKEIWRNSQSDEIVTEQKRKLEKAENKLQSAKIEQEVLRRQLQDSETKRKELEKNREELKKQFEDLEMQLNALKNNTLASAIDDEILEFSLNDKVSFKMIRVEGGSFQMGAQKTDPSGLNYDEEAWDDENPVHKVTLSSFYMGEVVVTQALWKAVMGTTVKQQRDKTYPEWQLRGEGDNYPMYVSWNECQEFIKKLNSMSGKNFRLPTEAEWEYAARGGKKSHGYKYSGGNTIGDVAWYADNSGYATHPVKGKKPNELGLYDMSGNVWEWCQDWYNAYSSSEQTNPTGSSSGSFRVLRGGGWRSDARRCRVSARGSNIPDSRHLNIGFRLVLPE